MKQLYIFGVIVALAMFVLLLAVFLPSGTKKNDKECSERFTPIPSNFLVFNYFPRHSLKIDIMEQLPDGKYMPPRTLVEEIQPKKTAGIDGESVVRYLKPGNLLKISIIDAKGEITPYADYYINVRNDERIKNLHIGMVTTRFTYNTSDGLHLATTSANAGQGNAWLMIHNVTDVPLSLNDGEIIVDPHSTYRYLGYLNQGVTLGTYFDDDNGLYPRFQYLRPHSDLYYGVTSDLRQPLLGCLQYGEFSDDCRYGETLWPFQEGIL